MTHRTQLAVPIILVALLPVVAVSQRYGEADFVQDHGTGIMQTSGARALPDKRSFPRPNWTVRYASGSPGFKTDQWFKIAFVSRLVSSQITDASIRVQADQLAAIEFSAKTEKESDLLQGPRSGCSYARSMMPDSTNTPAEVLVATSLTPGAVSRLAERLRPKHPVRFVWNEAGEQRSMVVKVNDCEYQSFIANARWLAGGRWQEIEHELK